MAKKTVATLQSARKKLTRAVRMVKSKKSGAWVFEEKMMPAAALKDFFEE